MKKLKHRGLKIPNSQKKPNNRESKVKLIKIFKDKKNRKYMSKIGKKLIN